MNKLTNVIHRDVRQDAEQIRFKADNNMLTRSAFRRKDKLGCAKLPSEP